MPALRAAESALQATCAYQAWKFSIGRCVNNIDWEKTPSENWAWKLGPNFGPYCKLWKWPCIGKTIFGQPRRVGSFIGGGQLIYKRGPIFFDMVPPYIRYKSRGASTLPGEASPPWAPDNTRLYLGHWGIWHHLITYIYLLFTLNVVT